MPTESRSRLAGKKAAKTKVRKEAGRESVNTKTIREAKKRLAKISIEVDVIQRLLEKVETKQKRGKRPPKRA
jgi:hypothetical protein